jgi:hypothetical protein
MNARGSCVRFARLVWIEKAWRAYFVSRLRSARCARFTSLGMTVLFVCMIISTGCHARALSPPRWSHHSPIRSPDFLGSDSNV